jgi:hypothetical protein
MRHAASPSIAVASDHHHHHLERRMHRALGFAHATAYHHAAAMRRRFAAQDGQGTVEYVGLILLIAGIMAAVVAMKQASGDDLGKTIIGKLKDSIDGVGDAPSAGGRP